MVALYMRLRKKQKKYWEIKENINTLRNIADRINYVLDLMEIYGEDITLKELKELMELNYQKLENNTMDKVLMNDNEYEKYVIHLQDIMKNTGDIDFSEIKIS